MLFFCCCPWDSPLLVESKVLIKLSIFQVISKPCSVSSIMLWCLCDVLLRELLKGTLYCPSSSAFKGFMTQLFTTLFCTCSSNLILSEKDQFSIILKNDIHQHTQSSCIIKHILPLHIIPIFKIAAEISSRAIFENFMCTISKQTSGKSTETRSIHVSSVENNLSTIWKSWAFSIPLSGSPVCKAQRWIERPICFTAVKLQRQWRGAQKKLRKQKLLLVQLHISCKWILPSIVQLLR